MSHHLAHPLMIYTGEVAADIGLEHVTDLPCHNLQAQGSQSVMRVASRPKPIAAVEEIGFEHRFKDARYRSLQQAISDSGDTQRPRTDFARTFRYLDPSDRWSAVSARSDLCTDLFNPLLQPFPEMLGALPIDPTGRFPVHHLPCLHEKCRRQQVS
jgi:hypothetical protein